MVSTAPGSAREALPGNLLDPQGRLFAEPNVSLNSVKICAGITLPFQKGNPGQKLERGRCRTHLPRGFRLFIRPEKLLEGVLNYYKERYLMISGSESTCVTAAASAPEEAT